MHSKLVSEVDPSIRMIRVLEKCKVFQEDFHKMQFLKYLARHRLRLTDLLFRVNAKKW